MNSRLKDLILKAMGEVSLAWTKAPKGEFKVKEASKICNSLMREIQNEISRRSRVEVVKVVKRKEISEVRCIGCKEYKNINYPMRCVSCVDKQIKLSR